MTRDVALVTCRPLPDPDEDEEALLAALAARGLAPRLVVWHEEPPPRGALTLLRSPWDYARDRDGFLAWCARASALANPLATVRWSTHKGYLLDLAAAGVPIVPTVLLRRGKGAGLAAACAALGWDDVVVKPAVGAGSRGARRLAPADGQGHLDALLARGDALVQPWQASLAAEGERDVVVLAGEPSHVVVKAGRLDGDPFVASPARAVEPAEAAAALRALAVARAITGDEGLLYGRVDLARDAGGTLRVVELELVEPALFLVRHPPALAAFADAIAARAAALPAEEAAPAPRSSGRGSAAPHDPGEGTLGARCPRCPEEPLALVRRAGQVIEACGACGGLWFDPGELTALLGVHRPLDAQPVARRGLRCPRCAGDLEEVLFPGTAGGGERGPPRQGLRRLAEASGAAGEAAWDGGLGQVVGAAASRRALELVTEAEEARRPRVACPRCGGRLVGFRREGQALERCEGCRGLWFDPGELSAVVGVHRKLDLEAGRPAGLTCLACGAALRTTAFPGTEVELSGCPACQGVWLDGDRLEALAAALRPLTGDAAPTLQERAAALAVERDVLLDVARAPSCPACAIDLEPGTVARGVKNERCPGCEGRWFDAGQLSLALGVVRKVSLKGASPADARCPRCPDQALVAVDYPGTGVAHQVCPDCRGAWLPSGAWDGLTAAIGGAG